MVDLLVVSFGGVTSTKMILTLIGNLFHFILMIADDVEISD